MPALLKKSFLLAVLLIGMCPRAAAQAISTAPSFRQIEGESWLRIQYENDLFHNTDYYCTQGWLVEASFKSLRRTFLRRILLQPEGSATAYTIALEGDAYTPTSITVDTIQYGDRPYAATLFAKGSAIAKTKDGRGRLYSALTIGVIGPPAAGYEVQACIHRLTGDAIPQGWDYQVRTDLLLNYEVSYERLLWSLPGIAGLSATGRIRAGTLSTKGGAGLSAVAGKLPALFGSGAPQRWNAFAYASLGADAVAYDATMQGGLLSSGDVYVIDAEDIERIVPWWQAGIVVARRSLSAEIFSQYLAPEFRNAKSHRVGGIRIGIRL